MKIESYRCDWCGYTDEDIMYYRDVEYDLDFCCNICKQEYFEEL